MRLFKKLINNKDGNEKSSDLGDISCNINENIEKIVNEFGNPSDLFVNVSSPNACKGLLYASIYFNNLVDNESLNSLSVEINEILKSDALLKSKTSEGYFSVLENNLSVFRKLNESSKVNILIDDLLTGKTVFLVDGCSKFFSVDIYHEEGRAVSEPTAQNTIRGPKDAFTEKIGVNISLIRKRIKNKHLRVDYLTAGDVTNTQIVIAYISNIAKPEIVNEVRRRLGNIEIDGILDTGYIEELIKDDKYSIFPTFLNSEKPDSVVAALLEGRVAIIADGTAFVLTAPALFIEFLQASEDYYHQFIVASVIRLVRCIAFFLTMVVPAGYIALTTLHQEMLPTPLLISIAAQREGVPFPALLEALLMEGIFEILREAGIRMPRVIGPAISIVGALVLGQAAVDAGLISAVMVIVVSITAISSFVIPNYNLSNAIRVIRFILMLLAGIFGLYGIFMGLMVLTLHLCKLKSIGIPYMLPISPRSKNGFKDTIFRFPLNKNKYRPTAISDSSRPRASEGNTVTKEQKRKPEFR